MVYGWPSKGGVYTLHDCLGVEFEFLGFDRFNPPKLRAGSQAEEDAHCDRSQFISRYFQWPSPLLFPLFFFFFGCGFLTTSSASSWNTETLSILNGSKINN